MTVQLADRELADLADLASRGRPSRRSGIDFANEAANAALAARARAESARGQAGFFTGADARRLRREAEGHDRDACHHEEAVAVMLSLVVQLRA